MPTAGELERALFQLAPRDLAESWDNVGLLVGDCGREIHRALIALDVTAGTAAEAKEAGAELLVAHHPVMNCNWSPVQTLRDDSQQGRLLLQLVRDGTAAICMHTNLDAAQGGVNDALARQLGLEQTAVLEGGGGIVRMGLLPEEMPLPAFLALVRERLRPNGIRFADGGRPVRRVAVGGGACGEFFAAAAEQGCDAFVTADVKYNQFMDAAGLGLSILDAGHFPTEDVVCAVLAQFLQEQFPALEIIKSVSHREIVQYYV